MVSGPFLDCSDKEDKAAVEVLPDCKGDGCWSCCSCCSCSSSLIVIDEELMGSRFRLAGGIDLSCCGSSSKVAVVGEGEGDFDDCLFWLNPRAFRTANTSSRDNDASWLFMVIRFFGAFLSGPLAEGLSSELYDRRVLQEYDYWLVHTSSQSLPLLFTFHLVFLSLCGSPVYILRSSIGQVYLFPSSIPYIRNVAILHTCRIVP